MMKQENLHNILSLLKLIGGKFILVEDGEPRAVLMSYEEFSELASSKYENQILEKFHEADIVNKEIIAAQLSDLREEVIVDDLEIRIEPLT